MMEIRTVKTRKRWADFFDGRHSVGVIYEDTSSKGAGRKTPRHDVFRAELSINNKRYRFRSKSYFECEKFLFELIKANQSEMGRKESVSILLRNWCYE